MSQQPPTSRRRSGGLSALSGRTIAGIVVTILVLIFIAVNREKTSISFIVFTARTALWVALTIAAVGGFGAGFMVGRRRYRS